MCADACPTDAITVTAKGVRLDLGRCLFCTECDRACPEGAIRFTPEHRLAARARDELIVGRKGAATGAGAGRKAAPALRPLAQAAPGQRRRLQRLRGRRERAEHPRLRSGPLRHPVRRLSAPRRRPAHHRSRDARTWSWPCGKTYDAMPAPKLVIAVGACAISGGPYLDHPEQRQRRGRHRAGGPLHPRLPAAPVHHPRRPAAAAGPAG